MVLLLALLQNPIIVDVVKQPEPTNDISLDFVVGMFAMAGIFLLAAALGSLVVAGVVILLKRRQTAGSDDPTPHTRLKI